jgi:hypothetical protein
MEDQICFVCGGPITDCDCGGEGSDDDCGYDLDDPKHPSYYERMTGLWDS